MFSAKRSIFSILVISLLTCPNLPAFSVQNIVNIPSSEILPEGTIILKESNNIRQEDVTRMNPSAIFGIGHGMEISTGVSAFVSGENAVRGDIGIKKVFFISKRNRLTVGGMISPYLNQNSEPDTFVYSHLSHRIKKSKTSLTAGVYSASRRDCLPSNAGALIGFDQVLIPNKLRLAVDYRSGGDDYGLFAAGLKYRPIPTLSITSAVLVSPRDDERVGFSLSVSKFISLKKQPTKKEHI